MAGIAVAVAVVFGLLLAVRLVQGSPPEAEAVGAGSGPRVSAPALPGPGDRLVVAQPGDSLWSIALALAPESDPRPIVDALAAANNGTSIVAGQRLVVPAELVTQLTAAGDELLVVASDVGTPAEGSEPAPLTVSDEAGRP